MNEYILSYFMDCLSQAKNHGLEYEFLKTFFQDYRSSKNMMESINFAMREWDIG